MEERPGWKRDLAGESSPHRGRNGNPVAEASSPQGKRDEPWFCEHWFNLVLNNYKRYNNTMRPF